MTCLVCGVFGRYDSEGEFGTGGGWRDRCIQRIWVRWGPFRGMRRRCGEEKLVAEDVGAYHCGEDVAVVAVVGVGIIVLLYRCR